MIKVALDAMGGDNAPEAVVEGAVLAAREAQGRYGIVLAGPQDTVDSLLKKYGWSGEGIEVFHAPGIFARGAAIYQHQPVRRQFHHVPVVAEGCAACMSASLGRS